MQQVIQNIIAVRMKVLMCMGKRWEALGWIIHQRQALSGALRGDYKEPDYIDADIFTPIVKTGEPKVSAGKEQNPNISVIADNESHCAKLHSELFCVTGKDSGFIDIEDLY